MDTSGFYARSHEPLGPEGRRQVASQRKMLPEEGVPYTKQINTTATLFLGVGEVRRAFGRCNFRAHPQRWKSERV